MQRYIGFDWNLESRTVAITEEKVTIPSILMAAASSLILGTRSHQPTWKVSTYFLHFPFSAPFLADYSTFRTGVQISSSETASFTEFTCRSFLGLFSNQESTQRKATQVSGYTRSPLVGGCEHVLWNWPNYRSLLGRMEVDTRFQRWSPPGVRHRLGRGCCCGARLSRRPPSGPHWPSQRPRSCLSRSFRQCRNCFRNQQREIAQSRNQQNVYLLQAQFLIRLSARHVTSRENIADALSRRAIAEFLTGFPSVDNPFARPPFRQTDMMVAPCLQFVISITPASTRGHLVATQSFPPSLSLPCQGTYFPLARN